MPVILSGVAASRSEAVTQSKDPLPLETSTAAKGNSYHESGPNSSTMQDHPTRQALDVSALKQAIENFERAGKRLNEAVSVKLSSASLDPKLASDLNRGMMQVERNWLNPDGIPGRPWFKHTLYGARFTYAHLELPGLTEAVEKQDWPTAKKQAQILQHALENNTKLLNDLESRLEK